MGRKRLKSGLSWRASLSPDKERVPWVSWHHGGVRVGVVLGLLWLAAGASAQVDAVDEDSATREHTGPGVQPPPQVRNKTTAERISSPVPTTQGVPWSFPLFWDQSLSVRTLSDDSQLTRSPNYTWWFTAAPRWAFNDIHSIGVNFGLSVEWTDSPATDFERVGFESREVLVEDLRLDYLISVPGRPGGFMFFVAADLRLPTSKFSRARDRYFSPGIRATVVRPFNVLAGMQLGATAAFWGWIAGSNVALGVDDVLPCRIAPGPGGGGGFDTDSCFGALSSVKHSTRLSLFWTFVPIDRLALGLRYTAVWVRGFDLATGCVDTLTGQVCIGDGSDNNHWRTFGNFRAIIGYDIKRWFTVALSYDTWAAQPRADGGRENPFYNENSRLIFSLTFRTDGLYASTRDKRAARAEASGASIEEF